MKISQAIFRSIARTEKARPKKLASPAHRRALRLATQSLIKLGASDIDYREKWSNNGQGSPGGSEFKLLN